MWEQPSLDHAAAPPQALGLPWRVELPLLSEVKRAAAYILGGVQVRGLPRSWSPSSAWIHAALATPLAGRTRSPVEERRRCDVAVLRRHGQISFPTKGKRPWSGSSSSFRWKLNFLNW